MSGDTTRDASTPPSLAPTNIVLTSGRRHRCAFCAGEPEALCHHCGRALCAGCRVELPVRARRFWAHGELAWRQGRGHEATRLATPVLEAIHCPECVHFGPRLGAWLTVAFPVLLLLVLGLAWWGLSIGYILALTLAFSLLLGGWLSWRTSRASRHQQLFFPLDADLPTVKLRETFEGDAVLEADGTYRESFHTDGPQGDLRVTVPLDPVMADEVDAFQAAHKLDEDALAQVPARAGTVVVEEGMLVKPPATPPWPEEHTRRWTIEAPIENWPRLWARSGPLQQPWDARYDAMWIDFDRPEEVPPFPIQLQFRLPAHGERRQVEVRFFSRTLNPAQRPFFRDAGLRRGPGLPAFRATSNAGRATLSDDGQTVTIEDLKILGHAAHLHLYLDEALKPGEDAWLEGTVTFGYIGAFSRLKIAAFYDALGHPQKPPVTALSYATLHFRANLAALPYARTLQRECVTLRMEGTSTWRDDRIIHALAEHTQLARVAESHTDPVPTMSSAPPLSPRRSVMGYLVSEPAEMRAPVIYHLTITPQPTETLVQLSIEADTAEGDAARRLQMMCHDLRAIIQAAAADGAAMPVVNSKLATKLEARKQRPHARPR